MEWKGSERDWAGRQLKSGGVIIKLADLRARCVMTTYDPDTVQQDPAVLKDIVKRFGGKLARTPRWRQVA